MKKTIILNSLLLLILLSGCINEFTNPLSSTENQDTVMNKQLNQDLKTLPIPELVEDENPDPNILEFTLTAKSGVTEIVDGVQTPTFGYNGSILGPTVQTFDNQEVIAHIENELGERTTLHWHGLIVPGEMDGGPHQIIEEGATWSPSFTMQQPALTAWYHPHLMGTTAIQVYQGLAGMWIHHDQEELSLGLPSTYGVDDIPLVVQDRDFTSDGRLYYNTNMGNGVLGKTIIVNGQDESSFELPSGWVRFRLLNGSNAQPHNFSFGGTFYQIASDGGLLEAPIEKNTITLAPGERAELLVYFESDTNKTFEVDNHSEVYFHASLLSFNSYQLQETLVPIEHWDETAVEIERSFDLEGSNHMVSINGQTFYMNDINFTLKRNTLEKWTVRNVSNQTGGMMMRMQADHSFHVHGLQFQVLSRNGDTPPRSEQGWKDTVFLTPGEEVELLMRWTVPGVFMYHCHNLEHEDNGMMGQFEAIES